MRVGACPLGNVYGIVKKLFVDTKIMQEPFFKELLNLTHNNQGKAVVSDNVE